MVGYLRLASIPVFLVLAFSSDDGRDTTAALLYLWITFGDFVDGFLARATGQYSRLGALMDPVIDRLSALSGAAVCWHFDLLPEVVAGRCSLVREVATVVLARAALRRGLDLEISWVGRLATFGVFGGLFWTLVIDSWLTVALFLVGPGARDLRHDALRARRPPGPREQAAPGSRLTHARRSFPQPQLDVSGADL